MKAYRPHLRLFSNMELGDNRRGHLPEILIVILVSIILRFVVASIASTYNGDFPEMYPHLEPYEDYDRLYLPEVKKFLDGEKIYREFFHAYPPLWIYTLSAFAKFDLPFWGAAIPILIYDVLLAPLVYVIARKIMKGKIPLLLGVMIAASPVLLWYDAVFWLNPPPSTFFLLLSLYLVILRKFRFAAIALGIALAYKQTILIATPFILFAVYRWSSRRKSAEFLLIILTVVTLASLPYLVWYPDVYLWALGFPGIPTPSPYAPDDLTVWKYDITQPTHLGSVFGDLGFPEIAIKFRQNLLYVISAVFVGFLFLFSRIKKLNENDLVKYLAYSLLLFIFLFPRGTYKYFFVTALPFFALSCRKKGDIVTFVLLNLGILLVPRSVEPWFAFLMMFFIYMIARENTHLIENEEEKKDEVEGMSPEP